MHAATSAARLTAIRTSLEAATAKKKTIQTKLAVLVAASPEAPRTPGPDEIAQLAAEVAGRFQDDAVTTREFLRATVLKGSRLELFPRADGGWDVRSEILPLRIPPALTRKAPGVSSGAFKPVVQDGCGGRICLLPETDMGTDGRARLPTAPDPQVRRIAGRREAAPREVIEKSSCTKLKQALRFVRDDESARPPRLGPPL